MTTRRAVTYGGLFCLLAAWLASAASTTLQYQTQPGEPAALAAVPSTDGLVTDVQAQAARLRRRLASAPVPQRPHRNPFHFESRPAPRPGRPVETLTLPLPMPEPLPTPEPPLFLIGVAEDRGADGPTRTAILGDDADAIFMVTVGQTVLDRYRVEAIGADAVELRDVGTNAVRRLALR